MSLIIILGAVTAPSSSTPEQKPMAQVIDTSPPMDMSKCAPCHKDLNAFKNPNLINFNHPVHFKKGIRCESCHIEWPHQKSKLIKPTMDLCINCHRLEHSTQGMVASGQCDLCHPAGFNLVPQDHTTEFKMTGHSEEAKKSSNQKCLVCHQGETCRSCHSAQGLKKESVDAYKFYPVLTEPEPRKWGKITLGEIPVKMANCKPCHADLQLWRNPKLINFNHPVHFKKGIRCKSCHSEWPHKPGEILRPVMMNCAQCHRLSHSGQGLTASGECNLCHPSGMNLIPDFHTAEFIGGDHKTWAKNDRGLCRACHRQQFCDNCHRLGIDYVPHRLPGWRSEHGTVADSGISISTEGGFACDRCHLPEGPKYWYQSAPSCAKCHKAVVFPHKEPWAPEHGKSAKRVGKDACYTCHKKAQICQDCHRGIEMPHAADWLGRHRVYLQDREIGDCLVCHQKKQCEQCHATHKVHNQHTIYDFRQLREGL